MVSFSLTIETTVDKVLAESAAAIQDGQASQDRVADAANEVRDLTSDFRQVNKINEDLAVYNKKLEIQVTTTKKPFQSRIFNRSFKNSICE